MLGYSKKTKKDLKSSIGERFAPIETSIFGNEYNGEDGKYAVVGPDPYRERKWFAEVLVENGVIKRVK